VGRLCQHRVNGHNRSRIVPAIAIALLSYAAYMLVAGMIGAVRKKRRAGLEPQERDDTDDTDETDAASDEVWSARPTEHTASVSLRR
jgi:hypothetical protein